MLVIIEKLNLSPTWFVSTKMSAGDFSNTKYDEQSRKYLKDAYDTVTRLELWNRMKEEIGDGGFMFTQKDYVNQIGHALEFKEEHSGFSFSWMMRIIQSIAQDGWDAFYAKARI